MPLYRDEAVVLRTQKLGEADRIVTLLTREHGRVRAVGKGVRRTSSRFGARLEPFMRVDIQLYIGRSLDIVTQVETIAAYARPLAFDYARYTAGTAMLETAERFTAEEREPAVQQYLLLVGGLHALATRAHDPELVLDSFLLRSLSVAGYAPSFDTCVRCDAPGPHGYFAIAVGGAVCATCRPAGAATPPPQTLELLAALLTGDWDLADASERRQRVEASGLVAAYLQWHLERGLRSLRLVERTYGDGVEPPITRIKPIADVDPIEASRLLERSLHADTAEAAGVGDSLAKTPVAEGAEAPIATDGEPVELIPVRR